MLSREVDGVAPTEATGPPRARIHASVTWNRTLASGLRESRSRRDPNASLGPTSFCRFFLPGARLSEHVVAAPTARNAPGHGSMSLRALLRDTREQCADLSLPVPAVTAERTDGGQFPGLGPPRNGLGVNSEHSRDLRRCQKRLSLGCSCRHVYGLSSWTGTAILRCSFAWLRLEPAVDVLYGPLRPYCHHQR